MATSASYQWAEPPPDELKCAVCLDVAENPCQHGGEAGCGKVFCTQCISDSQRAIGRSCPTCRQPLTIFQDPKSARQIRALRVKCNSVSNGCQWVGELGDLETHLYACDYILVPCTNGCNVNMMKKDLSEHLANECPNRKSTCPSCNKKGIYTEITNHARYCTMNCPNSKCSYKGSYNMIQSHRENCKYERVSCKYAELGCQETRLRKHIRKHEEEDKHKVSVDTVLNIKREQDSLKEKMQVTESTAIALECRILTLENKADTLQSTVENRMTTMEEEIASISALLEQKLTAQKMVIDNLQTEIKRKSSANQKDVSNSVSEASAIRQCVPCTFKMTGYQKYKRSSDTFYSPNFYTSPGGYNMRVEVIINGTREGYLSVWVHVIQGDNSLTRPFTGQVTVELLNQHEDKNHHKKSIPLTFTASGIEESFTHFISHSDLERNPRMSKKNLQYLKEDTLFFRVSVQAMDHKPWLTCTN